MTAHGGTITINGNRYLVARDPETKRRLVDITLAPSAEGDLVEQELVASFGSGGMGSGLPAVRDQDDYSLDLDTWSVWDQVAAGDEVRTVGLALNNAVTRIVAATVGQGAIAGPRFGTTATDISVVGGVAWTNVANSLADDGVVATVLLNVNSLSNYARVTNFGFTLAGSGSIGGIFVEVKVRTSGTTAVWRINAQLVIGGVVQAGRTISAFLTGTLGYVGIGGLSDTWGATLSTSDLNDPTFGVQIQFVNLTSASTTISLDAVRLSVQQAGPTKLLYAAGGNVATKMALTSAGGTPVFSVVETKTFTHGDTVTAPRISDIRVNKDGTAAGNCFIVFGFGSDAQIQQINVMSAVGADTYGTLAAGKAYAGKFLATMSPIVGTSYLYKTGGSSQKNGAFNYLQYFAIGAAAVDATAVGTWQPGGDGMQISDPSTAINALTEFGRGPVAHKPEGSYTFDTKQAPFAMATWSSRVESNGANARSWQEIMLVPAEGDLAAIPPITRDGFVGLSTLQANLSPIVGTVEDMVGFRHAMYLLVWTGTDTYLVRVRRTDAGDRAPHPLLWWGVTKIAGYHAQALGVVADAQGTVYLLFSSPSATPGAHDVAYMVLAPESMRRTQTGGFLQTTRLGTAGRKMVLRSWPQFGVGLNSTNYFDADVQWDESGTWVNVGRFNQNGPQTLTWTPGTNDSGSQVQFRLRCTRSTDTNRPTLRGASSHQEGPGGIVVRAFVQPDTVTRITATLELGAYEAGQGGAIRETALEQKAALEALCGPTNAAVQMISRIDFGDEIPRWVRWQRMSEQPQPDTQPDKKPSWQAKLEGILL